MTGDINLTRLCEMFHYLRETVGDFLDINETKDNELEIYEIIDQLKDYLIDNNLDGNNTSDARSNEQIETILTLLIVNTKINNVNELSNITQFNDFTGAIPSLSQFLLIDIIIELNLVKSCCSLILTLPYVIGEEILAQFIPYSTPCESWQTLLNSFNVTNTIINMLISLDAEDDEQNKEIIDKLGDMASKVLRNMTYIDEKWDERVSSRHIHTHIGHVVFFLFKLFRTCPLFNNSLSRVVTTLQDVSTAALLLVSSDVLVTWSEENFQDQQLQNVIASEAFMLLEHIPEDQAAEQLIGLLNPMTLSETVTETVIETDLETVIANVDKADENQLFWFRGLINPSLFENQKAMSYLDKWAHLCTKDDVMKLLSLSVHHKESQVKALVLKCAKILTIQQLKVISKAYFCEYGRNYVDMGYTSYKKDLRTLMDKPESDLEVDDDFIKSLYLVLLQNPKAVLSSLYLKCLKIEKHASYLKRAFSSIKAPLDELEDLTKNVYVKLSKFYPPSSISINGHTNLLNVLIELDYFDTHTILNEILKPRLEEFLSIKDNHRLLYTLHLLNNIAIEYVMHDDILEVILVLSKILEKARCNADDFEVEKQEIVEVVLEIFSKYGSSLSIQQHNMQYKDFLDNLEVTVPMNKYHFTKLYGRLRGGFLDYACPEDCVDGTVEDLRILLNILPSCIGSEWMLVIQELDSWYNNYSLLLSAFEGILIYLCLNVIEHPIKTHIELLKYYVQQYAAVIENFLKPKYNTFAEEIALIESMCNILREMPESIRRVQGLELIELLSKDALQALSTDKSFIIFIIGMKDPIISEILAKKMSID